MLQQTIRVLTRRIFILPLTLAFGSLSILQAAPLKLHSIFTSNMVLQRDRPITIWG